MGPTTPIDPPLSNHYKELVWNKNVFDTKAQILGHLRPLAGLRLSLARRASSMRVFHFGVIRPYPPGTVGEFALHIQCPWRMESLEGMITGSEDLFRPMSMTDTKCPNFNWKSWSYDKDGCLQDELIEKWLQEHDLDTPSFKENESSLLVNEISADCCGGATIRLSGGYSLVLFPSRTRGEHWRIFRPGDLSHFVVQD